MTTLTRSTVGSGRFGRVRGDSLRAHPLSVVEQEWEDSQSRVKPTAIGIRGSVVPSKNPPRRIPPPREIVGRPSPDWDQQVLYFLLPDRFSDDSPVVRPPLPDRWDWPELTEKGSTAKRVAGAPATSWYWDRWAMSGRNRFQGGTLNGVTSRLPYLVKLGVTCLWIAPVWKQRVTGVSESGRGGPGDDPSVGVHGRNARLWAELQRPQDDYHGYAIQDFLAVDARFGTTADLQRLVAEAHRHGLSVVLDIVINHSGENFAYDVPPTLNGVRPPYDRGIGSEPGRRYPFAGWLDADNRTMPSGRRLGRDDGVWPLELQSPASYNRRGIGSYADGEFTSDVAEFRMADWCNRDFAYDPGSPKSAAPRISDPVLEVMVNIWTYWMHLTDCDGFRVDTMKHLPVKTACEFTRRMRQNARGCGKRDFLILGEIGGSDAEAATYLAKIRGLRILELGARRQALRATALGQADRLADVVSPSVAGLDGRDELRAELPAPFVLDRLDDAALGRRVVTSIDDHDQLGSGLPTRFAAELDGLGEHALPAALALLLFAPGIPCIYYGTEQALRGPLGDRPWLNDWGLDPRMRGDKGEKRNPSSQGRDRYLREAMFGPCHPRRSGRAGIPSGGAGQSPNDESLFDDRLPGFGPLGTCGYDGFSESRWFEATRALLWLRRESSVLRRGAASVLTTGRVDGGRLGDLPQGVLAWVRLWTPREGRNVHVALVVLDVRPVGNVGHTFEIALPDQISGGVQFVERLRITRDLVVSRRNVPTLSTAMPQTAVCSVDVADLAAGETRVYLAVDHGASPRTRWSARRRASAARVSDGLAAGLVGKTDRSQT
ncbi:MAG: alpha-amylase family glycosyl hydrolase [Ornithinibacter sp.]